MKKILNIIILIIASAIITNAANPVASNVTISGVNHVDAVLTGSYDFTDGDGDLESGTTYQWYRSDDNSGTNKAAIGGATASTYTLVVADFGKYITFEVTPRDDNSGVGSATESGYTDYIYDYADVTRANNYTHNVSGREDFGNYTANNQLTINIGSGDSLIIWLSFDVNNQTDIVVDPGGYFEVKGDFGVNNNSAINIDGVLTVGGNLDVVQNATFNIADGGSLDVSGDFTAGNNADLVIEGDVTVAGDLTVGSNAEITVDGTLPAGGTLDVGGDLTAGNGSTLLGDGDVTVGGTVTGPITGDSQLPVELVSFSANFENNSVKIEWVTAAEMNNDYFTIERSIDGILFETIITRTGAGNSSQMISYTEYDYSPLSGISYYRLKQTDYDGKYSYSNIAWVNSSILKSTSQVTVFPNPFTLGSSLLNIQVNNFDEDEQLNITVVDITGRTIYESLGNTGSSNMTIQFSNDIPKGTYFVIISNSTEREVSKLLIN